MGEMVNGSAEQARRIHALEASNRRLEKLAYDFAEAMMHMADSRDPYVKGHELKVAYLARSIAREMSLPDQDVEDISMAGLLCDIGKLGLPDEVLANPGKLSEPEYDQMKDHVEFGSEILSGIEFPGPVAEIVQQHHERLDGSGYPRGLKGDEIVMGARVLAVADVVEAMTADRPHRSALDLDDAIAEIRSRTELYDPAVVVACLNVLGVDGR
jgi:putative nucleotidyltransferase with HDIG domain